MAGLGVDVVFVRPRARVRRVEGDVSLTGTRIQPERHVHALDLLDVVTRREVVRQELLADVVFLQRLDRRIAVELERDDVIGFQHIGKLTGHDGVVATVRAVRDRRHLVDEHLAAARRAVERAKLLFGEIIPTRVAQVGVDGILTLHRSVPHVRAALLFRGLGGRLLPRRHRSGSGCVGFALLLLRRTRIGFRLTLGVNLLDLFGRELRFAELALQPADAAIEAKPAVAVRALVGSSLGHVAPPWMNAHSSYR